MLHHLKKEASLTTTENGAVTYKSTLSDCLDLFATIGALRHASDGEIINRFTRAYAEDRDIALKILFYARDIRGGLGERNAFRVCIRRLADLDPAAMRKNIDYIAEYGRYDDILSLLGTKCERDAISLIKRQLERDIAALSSGEEEISLLAKWLPSVNTSSRDAVTVAKRLVRELGMTEPQYRRTLSALRKRIRIIENNLRERDYSFDYTKQPSRAMFKYKKAFIRNDGERYREYLKAVESGESALNASNISPYELVDPYLFNNYGYNGFKASEEEMAAINATWASLPHEETAEDSLAVIDTSGSMYFSYCNPRPISVALSLGLYFAEHNKGYYRNHFIEFSHTPELIELKGDTFADRIAYACSFSQVADTNLEAVLELILHTAKKNKLKQSDLPARLVIISDMEFNVCIHNADETNLQSAKRKYREAGYELPRVVFWNVASRRKNLPVTQNEQGVTLVSGCTPKLFSMIESDSGTPMSFMMDVLSSPRYEKIGA